MIAIPVRRSPEPYVREALADEWAAAAWHEAGHAVIQAAAGLPLHRVQIAFRCLRSLRAVHWHVSARTRITRTSAFRRTTRDDLVTLMAGAEAEALWLHDTRGMTAAAARRTAQDGNDDDDRMALAFAGGDRQAVLEAADEAAMLVRLRQPAIAEVARLLQERGTLTGAEVRAVVTSTLPAPDARRGRT
jgi:hypothetical protein